VTAPDDQPPPITLPRPTPEQQAYFADLKARHISYDPKAVVGGIAPGPGDPKDAERLAVEERQWEMMEQALDTVTKERDAATRRVEALLEENTRLHNVMVAREIERISPTAAHTKQAREKLWRDEHHEKASQIFGELALRHTGTAATKAEKMVELIVAALTEEHVAAERAGAEKTCAYYEERAVTDYALAEGWRRCHDALLGFIQQRPEVLGELLNNDPRPPSPSPERGEQMVTALRREGAEKTRADALEILHEEGWLGRSEQRIAALPLPGEE
jgi:hypothetical protein